MGLGGNQKNNKILDGLLMRMCPQIKVKIPILERNPLNWQYYFLVLVFLRLKDFCLFVSFCIKGDEVGKIGL